MNRIGTIICAASLLLFGAGGKGWTSEDDSGGKASSTTKADKPGKGGKGGGGIGRQIFEQSRTARRAFVKSQMEKGKAVFQTLVGKDGDAVSAALLSLYAELYTNATEYIAKDKETIEAAINALDAPEKAKSAMLAQSQEHRTRQLARLEERQKERLAFAKSLAGKSAEDVKAAVQEHHAERRARMEEKRKEMQEKRGDKNGKHGKGKNPGSDGAQDDLIGADFGGEPAAVSTPQGDTEEDVK